MKRRSFLQKLASTGIVLPIAMGFPRMRAFASSPAGSPFMRLASSANDRIMILIRMAGGNDGLNTVVPYTNSDYYTARSHGTAENVAIDADAVVKLPGSGTLGLHPSLAPLLPLYAEGKMTIVQNVGYPNQNLSHFRSTDIWLSGSDADVYDNAGWYAKYLEEKYPEYPGVLPQDPFAIELGTYLSTTLIGEHGNMGVAFADLSYIPGLPGVDPVRPTHAGDEEEYVRQIARQSNIFSNAITTAYARQSSNMVPYPDAAANPLAGALAGIAKLIAGGLTTQMYIVNIGNYDTHSGQLAQQARLHGLFAEAVAAFQRDLEAFGLDERTCMMTISEFGRRVESNGSGTDHGSASPLMVIGTGVVGGIIGHDPDLGDLEGPGNLKPQYDFRQVYASVLGQWYDAPEEMIAPKALPRHFDQLPIFRVDTVSVNEQTRAAFSLGQNYPNPAAGATRIPIDGITVGMDARFTLYDLNGRALLRRPVAPGEHAVDLDTRGLPSGGYIYELTAGGARHTRTMTVTH